MSGLVVQRGRWVGYINTALLGILIWGLHTTAVVAQEKPVLRGTAGGGVGQEMKELEKEVRKPAPRSRRTSPAITIEEDGKPGKIVKEDPTKKKRSSRKRKAKNPSASQKPAQDGYPIDTVEFRGDVDFLRDTGLYEYIKRNAEGRELTDDKIQELIRVVNQAMIEADYSLASLWAPPADLSKGVLILQVDKGRVGSKTFYAVPRKSSTGKVVEPDRRPYKGKYYSEDQLRRRFSKVREGDVFDYFRFYTAAYEINSLLDVRMDTDLKVRKKQVDGVSQRFVDMDFTVEESLPIHGALSVANSGTDATGDWRPLLTLQHLNLTKHDDVLTLNLGPFSPNFKDLTSFGASYYLPNYWKNGGAFTLFGGYSDLDAQDVVESINVRGEGWFAGVQQSYRLIDSDRHLLTLALGLTYRYMEDQLILVDPTEGDWKLEPRDVTIVPLSLAFSYSSARPDFLGGRNYLTSQTIVHQADFIGSSTEAEMQTLRVNADGDYYIERLQLARIQPLSGKERGSQGWLMFAKADIQLASGPLVPAEQKAIGGINSVRGFPERIVQGDDGISGSVEIRTPLVKMTGFHTRSDQERAAAMAKGRTYDFQLVAFLDAGHVKIKESLSTVDSFTIAGAGVGVRLSLTRHLQARFDWGWPISGREDVQTPEEDISSGGRFHLSLQAQF